MADFKGFGPQALPFLKALGFHQDRAWFEENRGLYEDHLRRPLEALVLDLSARFMKTGLPLTGSAKSLFRLHRDTRFGKDKRPYKTNAGAVLTRDGTKKAPGLLYIHVDPEGCFVAAGFWHPEPAELLAIRKAFVGDAKAFRTVVSRLAKAGLGLDTGDPLARSPKGFETVDAPDLRTAVRMRNLVLRRPLPSESLTSPDLAATIEAFGHDAAPLLRFGWAALDRPGG